MSKSHLLFLYSLLLFTSSGYALSPEAEEGKALYSLCHSCHNPALEPPLGPPMWGVKRIYQRNSIDNEDFIQVMTDFVKAPTDENALHRRAVERLGVMPPMPLPDETLKKIGSYILEEDFPPPCEHWKNGVASATKSGDLEQAAREQRQLDRYCN